VTDLVNVGGQCAAAFGNVSLVVIRVSEGWLRHE